MNSGFRCFSFIVLSDLTSVYYSIDFIEIDFAFIVIDCYSGLSRQRHDFRCIVLIHKVVLYQKLLEKHGVTEGTLEILGEYLSVKWIQINRPDYATITSNVAEELKAEIIEARPQILGIAA